MKAWMTSPTFRRWLHILGGVLSVLSLVVVAFKLYQQSSQLHAQLFRADMAGVIVACVLVYACALGLLAHAWRSLLQHLSVTLPAKLVWKIYASSQLSKYLPGNIFQFVSRQLQGNAAGIAHSLLLRSSMLEVSGLILGAICPCVLLFPSMFGLYGWALVLIFVLIVWQMAVRTLGWLPPVEIWLFYLLFHVLAGLLFVWLLVSLAPDMRNVSLPVVLGAYLVSWLAGFVTPGAPGGIGVRELVLMLILQGVASETLLLQAIMVSRLVTISGDVLFFAVVRLQTLLSRMVS